MAATFGISRELLQAVLRLPSSVHITGTAMDAHTVQLVLDGPGLPEGATAVKALYETDPVYRVQFLGFEVQS